MTKTKLTPQDNKIRIDDMSRYCGGLRKTLDGIAASLASYPDEVEEIAARLGELDTSILQSGNDTGKLRGQLADLRMQIAEAKDDVGAVEADLYLNVCAELTDDNKLAYSNNDQRDAALKIAMANRGRAKSATAVLRALETEKAKLDAELGAIETQDKSHRLVYRGLVARLENVTARIQQL